VDPDSDGATMRKRSFRRRGLAVGAIALALLPVLAVIATRSWHHYLPLGDEAVIDLRTRDVFTSLTPLVGPYSRGFNHPGPALFWLLAPFSVLAGGAAWGTLVGAAVLQGTAIALSGWLAFRRGGLMLALLVVAGLGFAYSSFVQGDQLLQPWNPNVAFPFFMLFLLQLWSLTLGDRWQIAGVAVVGSLLVQFHIGYLPLVGLGMTWAGAVLILDRRRARAGATPSPPSGRVPNWRAVVVVTAGALTALWIAPVIEQLTDAHGNVAATGRYFLHNGDAVSGLRSGAGLFAAEFEIRPPWMGGSDRLAFGTSKVATASLWWLLIPAALLALGFVAANGARSRPARRLMQLALVMSIGSVIAISRVSVEVQGFLFFWRVIVAVFVVVATLWSLALWSRVHEHRWVQRAVLALLLLAVTLTSLVRANDDVLRHADALGPPETYAERLFNQAAPHALPNAEILVRGVGNTTAGFAQGLFDFMDRRGANVRVDPQSGYQYGYERVATPADVDQVWYISKDGSDRNLGRRPGGKLIASLTPLSHGKERELRRLQRGMRSDLKSAGNGELLQFLDNGFFGIMVRKERANVDQSRADRIGELNDEVARSGGCRCVVVSFPGKHAPDIPYSMGF
jgi:hypothetical protein